MLLAYIVYSFTLVVLMMMASVISKCYQYQRKYIILFICCFFAIVFGLRYDVGVDYLSYLHSYQYPDSSEAARHEWGYKFISITLSKMGFHFAFLYILVAFLQLYYFIKGIKDRPEILALTIFFYFTSLYLFLSLNVLRQCLAFSFIVSAVPYAKEKKFLKYMAIIIVATLFHKSAIMFVPLYWVLNKDRYLILPYQYLIYIASFFMGAMMMDLIWNNLGIFAGLIGYGEYADGVVRLMNVDWKSDGIGNIFFFLVNTSVIFLSYRVKEYYKGSSFLAFYNLYFIGTILDIFFGGTYLDRISLYFLNIRIIIYAYTANYIFRASSSLFAKMCTVIVMIVFIVFFFMAISNKASNCAPYQFIFG